MFPVKHDSIHFYNHNSSLPLCYTMTITVKGVDISWIV